MKRRAVPPEVEDAYVAAFHRVLLRAPGFVADKGNDGRLGNEAKVIPVGFVAAQPAFVFGYREARIGKAFNPDAFAHPDMMKLYEEGRLMATLQNRSAGRDWFARGRFTRVGVDAYAAALAAGDIVRPRPPEAPRAHSGGLG